ncbi:hypothetical protein D7V32_12535 [Acinetobacter tianfuensis]|uniref:Uncharacterized protein n=1 Tax=Acinetobacter tianfuensis TaxID=2419603 RepID=A0A3A8EGT3_9GAMM|nr:hypothetical protein D7V32_12535 [Acinetobacter tianfuensis]
MEMLFCLLLSFALRYLFRGYKTQLQKNKYPQIHPASLPAAKIVFKKHASIRQTAAEFVN